MLPSYWNQSTDLQSKSIDWFLYEGNSITSWVTKYFLTSPLRQISLAGIGLKVGCGTESCPALGEGSYCEMRDISSVIRQKGESQNGSSKKQSTPNFPKTRTYVCVSGGKKCLFFRKIWCALFSWNTRFQIRPFALLPTILLNHLRIQKASHTSVNYHYF